MKVAQYGTALVVLHAIAHGLHGLASHKFSRVGSSAYRKEAAELARDWTLAFLKQHLGSGVKVQNNRLYYSSTKGE